jgi:hypothetical protein
MFDYTLLDYWEPKVTQEEFNAMLNLEVTPTIPDQLMRLCDCAVFPDWSKLNVKIGANDRATLDLIFRKLQRVEDFFRLRPPAMVTHLVHAEDKSKFQLRFISLAKQAIKERTTLFDNNSKWNGYSTERLFSVRIMEYDNATRKYKPCKLDSGLVHSAYKTPEHSDWVGYVFCSREALSVASPMSDNSVAEGIRLGGDIKPEELICVYHAPPNPVAPTSEATSTTDQGESSKLKVSGGSDDYHLRQPQPSADAKLELGPRPGSPSDGSSTPSGDMSLGSELNHSFGLPLRPRPSGADEAAPEAGAIRRPRERKPVQTHGPPRTNSATPKLAEVAELAPEPTTRRVMRSNNQKMPPITNDVENLRTHNIQRIFETMSPAAEYARGWCGELKFEAKLGRLIFLDVDKGIVKKDIEWRQWGKLITPNNAPKSTFTRHLTTQHFDMEFLRDLKLPGGENMFSPAPISRRVTYDFDIEQNGKKFVLSVDGETFKPTLYGAKKTFGAVNMANPLHSWDYRIELVGLKPLDLNSHPFIKVIFNSLACVHGPDLTFTVEGPLLFVKRVLLKCETRYTVYLEKLRQGVPMELVTTEVQELQMSKSVEMNGKYRAIALPKNVMLRDAKLHWVCSVIPTHTSTLLQQNAQLEVGETTDWSTDEVLGRNMLPGLISVLNLIIRKIDYVGSTNNAFI